MVNFTMMARYLHTHTHTHTESPLKRPSEALFAAFEPSYHIDTILSTPCREAPKTLFCKGFSRILERMLRIYN